MQTTSFKDFDELVSENTIGKSQANPEEEPEQLPLASALQEDLPALEEDTSTSEKAGFWRTQLAYLRQENLTGSSLVMAWRSFFRDYYAGSAKDRGGPFGLFIPGKPDPDFNLTRSLEAVEEEDQHFFLDCKTQKEFDYVKSCLEEEKEDRRIISDTGLLEGLGYSAINVLADPITWTGLGLLGKAAKAPTLGSKILAGAGVGAMFGATSGGIKYATQNYRTWEEAAAETAFATGVGAVLPAFGMGLSKIKMLQKKFKEVAVDPASEFYWVRNNKTPDEFFEVQISSANEIESPDKLAISKKYSKLSQAGQIALKSSVWGQAVTSKFKTINTVADLYMRSNYVSNKVLQGIDRYPTVESLKDYSDGITSKFNSETLNILKKFMRTKEARENNIITDEFFAIARMDILLGPNNNVIRNSEIKEFTALWRDILQEKLDDAFEFGVTREKWNLHKPMANKFLNLETGEWVDEYYFPRVWDLEKINDNKQGFLAFLYRANSKLMPGATPEELIAKGNSQFMSINGANPGERFQAPDFVVGPHKGDLNFEKSRSIFAASESCSPWVNNNPLEIFHVIDRQISSEVALNKALRYRDIESLDALEKMLYEEYESNLTGFTRNEFDKARRLLKDIAMIETGSFRSEQIGKHPRLYAATSAARNIKIASSLGMTLSTSLMDPAIVVNYAGIKKPASLLVKDIANFFKNNPTVMGKMKEDLYEAAVAIELNTLRTAQRLRTPLSVYRGLRMPQTGGDEVEFTKGIANTVVKWSGVPWWTDRMKTWNGTLFVNDIFKIVTKDKLDQVDKVWLSKYRIPSEFVPRIKEQFDKYGDIYDTIRIPNLKIWSDREAKEIVATAISAQSHTTVLYPSKYDVPKLYNSMLGPYFFMFQSYMFSFTNNVLGQWTTGTAKHKLAAAICDLGLSVAVKWIKAELSGNQYGGIDDKRLWEEAAKNSSILGYLEPYVSTAVDIAEGFIERGAQGGVYNLVRHAPILDYEVNLLDNIFYGIKRGINSVRGHKNKPISEYRLQKIKSLLHGNNLPFIGLLLNNMIKSHVSSVGGKLTPTRKERYLRNKYDS